MIRAGNPARRCCSLRLAERLLQDAPLDLVQVIGRTRLSALAPLLLLGVLVTQTHQLDEVEGVDGGARLPPQRRSLPPRSA